MSSNISKNNSEQEKETGYLDQTLRPSKWADYIGQQSNKRQFAYTFDSRTGKKASS